MRIHFIYRFFFFHINLNLSTSFYNSNMLILRSHTCVRTARRCSKCQDPCKEDIVAEGKSDLLTLVAGPPLMVLPWEQVSARDVKNCVCLCACAWQKRAEDTLERQHPPFTVCFKQSVVVLRNSGKHTKQTHKRAAWWFYIFCVVFFFCFFNYKAAQTQTVCERWAISHIAPAGFWVFFVCVCVREIFFSCIPPFVSVCVCVRTKPPDKLSYSKHVWIIVRSWQVCLYL